MIIDGGIPQGRNRQAKNYGQLFRKSRGDAPGANKELGGPVQHPKLKSPNMLHARNHQSTLSDASVGLQARGAGGPAQLG